MPLLLALGGLHIAMKMEWNAGGWFGSQLGGSLWILVASVLSAIRDPSTGLILFAIFAAPNIVGYLLWRKQNLSCYKAMQILIGLMGICGLLAIFVLDRGQLWREIQSGGSISAASAYLLVTFVFALLMVVFYFRFGRDDDGPAT